MTPDDYDPLDELDTAERKPLSTAEIRKLLYVDPPVDLLFEKIKRSRQLSDDELYQATLGQVLLWADNRIDTKELLRRLTCIADLTDLSTP